MRSFHFKALIIISLAVLMLSFQPAQASPIASTTKGGIPNWTFQWADDAPSIFSGMGDHAAVYDSSGNLHVVYGGDHLYYAYCVGSTCSVQTVDASVNVGSQASLALDSLGRPHIAYHDAGLDTGFCNDWKVKYATWNGSQWIIQVVDESCTGINPSIAVDAANHPHISYFSESWDDLVLADWDGTSWNPYSPSWLPYVDLTGEHSSLVADASGNLHLGFITVDDGQSYLQYIKKTGDSWGELQQVDSQAGAMNFAMTVSNNNPHFSYHIIYNPGSGEVYKVRYNWINNGIVQSPVTLDDMEYQGRTSLVVDNSGYPRVAYKKDNMVYSIRNYSTGWGIPAPVLNTEYTEWMGMGFTQNGPSLTYNIFGTVWNTSSIGRFQIDTDENLGKHISMDKAANGDLHIAYTDLSETTLKYTHRSGSTWQVSSLLTLTGDNLIFATDIDLGPNDWPYIVYEESDASLNRVIKLIQWNGSAWSGPIQIGPTNGCSPSMEVNSAGAIWIAYNRCGSSEDLWLARYAGEWQYEVIDTDAYTTAPSLRVDSNGLMHIAYVIAEYLQPTLRYAIKEGSQSATITDVHTLPYGYIYSPNLVMDGSGKPHISFTSYQDDNVFFDYYINYATWTGTQWLVDPMIHCIDLFNMVAPLVVDAQGRPQIAFSWSGLSYVIKENNTWSMTFVDYPLQDTMDYTVNPLSIAMQLNNQGLPVIAYNTDYDIKVAELAYTWKLNLPMIKK